MIRNCYTPRTTTIRLPTDVRERLDRYLKRSRLSLNQLVAAAIAEYLDRHDKRKAEPAPLINMDEIDIRLLAEILHKQTRDE
jgi:metal-responsive CopG/Arc/MetJ family transcriptional regulator